MTETYNYQAVQTDPTVKLFCARRCGRSHIKKNKPCQDYCMTAETERYIILTASDGVSSCDHSDLGSELACKSVISVVEEANRLYSSEKKFVNYLRSMKFRRKVVKHWVKEVTNVIRNSVTEENMNLLQELQKYGATLMYVIITKHWYIAGNLGDGQILFFNNYDAVRVRDHLPKDSSKVRALVHEKCYLEDFQVAVYPRNCFDGVLLSTDGMYDVLSPGINFHKYALQIKERFLEAGEPLQPFHYKERESELLDIWGKYTTDDCSIVLAIDEKKIDAKEIKIHNEIEAHSDISMLDRKEQNIAMYSILKEDEFRRIVVKQDEKDLPEIPELKTVIVENPIEEWKNEEIHYFLYQENTHPTLELLYSSGRLREQRENKVNASKFSLEIYLKLIKAQEELEAYGLTFHEASKFLIRIDEKNRDLYVMREAICKESGSKKAGFWEYFASMIGILCCGEEQRPLFHTGYVSGGKTLFRIDNEKKEIMCCVQTEKNTWKLKNVGEQEWLLENGRRVVSGESVILSDGMTIILPTDIPDCLVQYHYYTKESLWKREITKKESE